MKKTLATMIRQAREKKGMTQTQLGRALGVGTDAAAQVTISKYERGVTFPQAANLQKLIRVLRLPKRTVLRLIYGRLAAV
jgi:transcriptional regulator with XRE-family HTH domain